MTTHLKFSLCDLWAIIGRVIAFVIALVALDFGSELPVEWLDNHLPAPSAAHPIMIATVNEARLAVCALAAFAFVVQRLEKRTLAQSGFDMSRIGRDLAIGFALGLLVMGLSFAAEYVFGLYRILGISPHFYPLLVLSYAICVGIFEETSFRGLLWGLIERRAGTGWALFVTSILFGLIHVINPDENALHVKLCYASAVAIGGGLALGGAYLWTRRLWMPIALHAGWDFLGFILNGTVDLPSAAAYVTRSSPSLYGYLFMALAAASVGVCLLVRAIQTGEWKPAGEIKAAADTKFA